MKKERIRPPKISGKGLEETIKLSDLKPEDTCTQCGWPLCNPINDESLVCGNPSCGFWGTTPDPVIPVSEKEDNMVTFGGHDFGCTVIRPMTPEDMPPPVNCAKSKILQIKIREYFDGGCPDGVLADLLIYAKQALEDCEKEKEGIIEGRTKYAEELQQIAEAVGMPLARGTSVIARVRELVTASKAVCDYCEDTMASVEAPCPRCGGIGN